MRKILILFYFCFGIGWLSSAQWTDSATPVNAQPSVSVPTGDNWVLEFSDEFNTLDASKWNATVSTKSRAPRWDKGIQDWWWKADHVSVDAGKLVLKVTKPDGNTMYCGSVDSKGLYEPLYGFMEARIQIAPVSEAIHTAFWTQGYNQGNVDDSGADGCEVDIFESPRLIDKCQTVLHWDGYGADKKAKTNHWDAPGVHTGYHTFAMHWTPDFITIYYDGIKKWTYTDVGIPQVKEWLWLSVGASFGDGDFTNGTYPAHSYVDYVRVWKKDTSTDIQDVKSQSKIHLSQNPVRDELQMVCCNEIEEAIIFDRSGSMVKRVNHQNTINVSNLPKGLYLLKANQQCLKFIKE